LNNPAAVESVMSAWLEATQWLVGEYLFMPDHVHFFCAPGVMHPESVKKWSRYWKRISGIRHSEIKHQWQTDVWDTQMRDYSHYEEKLSYVRQNPVRAGLVSAWEEWPFRGRIHTFRW